MRQGFFTYVFSLRGRTRLITMAPVPVYIPGTACRLLVDFIRPGELRIPPSLVGGFPGRYSTYLYFQAGRDEFRVCVIEKAATVGGHILSGGLRRTPKFFFFSDPDQCPGLVSLVSDQYQIQSCFRTLFSIKKITKQ